ncbi:MAG: sigma-54-dependent Fis family transcriptional regulator [Acidimicrobiia bacterium]|nr:sigma-54-dependent Fis family transcriptional regulator [Acidimicrobiia bacterium]
MVTKKNGTILVVDDEEIMREILEALLSREGYTVRLATSGEEGLALARSLPFDAAIVDIMMPGLDGIATLDELKRIDEDLAVIIITAFASVESAISAMKAGAFDYITKPFKNDEVLVVVRNALERRRLVHENRNLRQNIQERYHKFGNVIGKSPRMRQVFDLIIQAAPSRSPILLHGESGVGKELVARAIHSNSSRSECPFVTVSIGNQPAELLESTLFGHVAGAFAGADGPKKGLFDLADRGTIFIDEIANVPIDTQAKLLSVIQDRAFMRLGGVETIRVDARIIAATTHDLRQLMTEGRFREDLFYRLHVVSIDMPPLRDRRDDIPLLARHFLLKHGDENRKGVLELTSEALDVLAEYDWPGNVRELENVVERAAVLTAGPRIGVDLLPDQVRRPSAFYPPSFVMPPEGISFKEVITGFEKRLIESTLETAGGVQKRAAELLHIKPTTLSEMIKRYDIRPRRRRHPSGGGEGGGADDAS